MPLPDWNHNGKRDAFDAFVDMKIIEAVNKKENQTEEHHSSNQTNVDNTNIYSKDKDKNSTGISMGGKTLYDASKDSDGMIILKTFSATAILIAGLVIPVKAELESLGVLISIFSSIGLALAILKNT